MSKAQVPYLPPEMLEIILGYTNSSTLKTCIEIPDLAEMAHKILHKRYKYCMKILTGLGMNKIKAWKQLDKGGINLLSIHRKVTDTIVIELAINCPTLTMINLSYCSKITNKSVSTFSECCPKLRMIDLNGCINITGDVKKLLCDKGVKVFPRHIMNYRAKRRRRSVQRLGARHPRIIPYLIKRNKNKKRRKTS